jgi:hypothetical protein
VVRIANDYLHAEGSATLLDDYRWMGCAEHDMPGLLRANINNLTPHH